MAKKIDGKHIKYVSERHSDVDEIIGREGALIIKNDELIVYASQDILFRAKIDDLKAWELLSLDGVVLTAPDLEHDGIERTIIAYYKYYR
ncbi:MAG: hypothetical protein IKT70_09270 [Clostridia bacterium]|nr:hypothetical protein [Clostridia bacterium]